MSTEEAILTNINNTITEFLNNIENTVAKITDIQFNIQALNNNYFVEDRNHISKRLAEIVTSNYSLLDIHDQLTKLKASTEFNLEKIANNRHTHEWIEDTIDVSLDQSMTICYCRKCEISKKPN
jgi:hypothetical protein